VAEFRESLSLEVKIYRRRPGRREADFFSSRVKERGGGKGVKLSLSLKGRRKSKCFTCNHYHYWRGEGGIALSGMARRSTPL